MSSTHEAVITPFPASLRAEPTATHCRGTLLAASIGQLRARGHFAAYVERVAPEHLDAIVSALAGTWLPIEVGAAHYRACDALALTIDEQLALGAGVVAELQRTYLGGLLKALATGVAISPTAGLERFSAIYARSFRGGGARVVRVGPKDARVDVVGQPLASIRYFRVAYRGFIRAGCELFARRVFVSDAEKHHAPSALSYRIAWA